MALKGCAVGVGARAREDGLGLWAAGGGGEG